MNPSLIIKNLKLMFEEAKCELNYNNDYELLIAIILSAQCTDKKVNKCTAILFKEYPTLKDLKDAPYEKIESIVHPLGLSQVKAKNIQALAAILLEKYNGIVPNKKEELVKLPGVGNKTANVMLIEYFNTPAFPVDTHVNRVSKRLGICNENENVSQIETKLKEIFSKEEWALLHIRMVLFGRYICKAIKPNCNECLFKGKCTYNKQ